MTDVSIVGVGKNGALFVRVEDVKAIVDSHEKRIEELEQRCIDLQSDLEIIEELRPHWAKGFNSASVAAQLYMNCTISMWEALGVSNQTEAMMKLKEMNDE